MCASGMVVDEHSNGRTKIGIMDDTWVFKFALLWMCLGMSSYPVLMWEANCKMHLKSLMLHPHQLREVSQVLKNLRACHPHPAAWETKYFSRWPQLPTSRSHYFTLQKNRFLALPTLRPTQPSFCSSNILAVRWEVSRGGSKKKETPKNRGSQSPFLFVRPTKLLTHLVLREMSLTLIVGHERNLRLQGISDVCGICTKWIPTWMFFVSRDLMFMEELLNQLRYISPFKYSTRICAISTDWMNFLY